MTVEIRSEFSSLPWKKDLSRLTKGSSRRRETVALNGLRILIEFWYLWSLSFDHAAAQP